ncbi:MAG: hypothetical protein SGCHY_002581 [Lobulomycetales sp.]
MSFLLATNLDMLVLPACKAWLNPLDLLPSSPDKPTSLPALVRRFLAPSTATTANANNANNAAVKNNANISTTATSLSDFGVLTDSLLGKGATSSVWLLAAHPSLDQKHSPSLQSLPFHPSLQQSQTSLQQSQTSLQQSQASLQQSLPSSPQQSDNPPPQQQDAASLQLAHESAQLSMKEPSSKASMKERPKMYAVKIFSPKQHQPGTSRTTAAEFYKKHVKRVEKEYEISLGLHHRNIVQTFALCTTTPAAARLPPTTPAPVLCLVMQHLPGGSLYDLIESRTLPRIETDCILAQLSAGVAHLHTHGLAHRDLKPENLVFSPHGTLKICDFGVAVAGADVQFARGVCGSEPYIAPELFAPAARYDARAADVWSVACIYFAMRYRSLPWRRPVRSDPHFNLFYEWRIFQGLSNQHQQDLSNEHQQQNLSNDHQQNLSNQHHQQDLSNQHQQNPSNQHQHQHQNPSNQKQQNHSNQQQQDHSNEHQQQNLSNQHHQKDLSNEHHQQNLSNQHHQQDHSNEHKQDISNQNQEKDHSTNNKNHEAKKTWDLIHRLGPDCAPLMDRMLTLDPAQRATIQHVLADPWVAGIKVCVDEPGLLHTHFRDGGKA